MTITAVCLVVGALLAVVVGQAVLANGQVRLSSLGEELSLAQAAHRQSELSVAQLETPPRIVAAATTQLHMVHPDSVTELPYVQLTVPLPPPKVSPAPAPAPAPATTGNTGAAASSTTTTSTP
jgi:hypothetical protein